MAAFQEIKIPLQAWADLSAAGDAEAAATYWLAEVEKTQTLDLEACRCCVKASGAFTAEELAGMSDFRLKRFALWMSAGGAYGEKEGDMRWVHIGE